MDVRNFFGRIRSGMPALTNEAILYAYTMSERTARSAHVTSMRVKYPKLSTWTDDEIVSFSEDGNSYSQSRRCRGGKEVERFVEECLRASGVVFQAQVPMDANGILTKQRRGMKILDIVFGTPVIGDHISKYAVMSLKTSTRERGSEDDWTFTHKPSLYLYATLSNDYPCPEKFQESHTRKLVCATPKADDTRLFKLTFEDIPHEVKKRN